MKENSCGIIPLRKTSSSQIEVFMIQHREGHWGFPKGHREKGEKPQETAQRELQEETGFEVTSYLNFPALKEKYHLIRQNRQRSVKEVTYYLAWVEGDFVKQEDEVNMGEWYPLDEIEETATHIATKQVCRQTCAVLKTILS